MWYSVISVPDLSAIDLALLAPVVYWEYRPLRPDTDDSLSNSDRRTPKSTVVSVIDLREKSSVDGNMHFGNFYFCLFHLRSYSVWPDREVLCDLVDLELSVPTLKAPGA